MPEDRQTVGMHNSENIPHLGPCCLSTMGLYDVIKLRTLHFIYQQPSVIMSVIHPSWFRVIIALCEAIYQTFTLFRFAFFQSTAARCRRVSLTSSTPDPSLHSATKCSRRKRTQTLELRRHKTSTRTGCPSWTRQLSWSAGKQDRDKV